MRVPRRIQNDRGSVAISDTDTLLLPGWREANRTINGLSLHVVEAGHDGDLLPVLLHGLPEVWWVAAPDHAAGYHVVVPEMRGYNTSDAPPEVAAYQIDTLATDMVAPADAFGAACFHMVGHDWAR